VRNPEKVKVLKEPTEMTTKPCLVLPSSWEEKIKLEERNGLYYKSLV